ncbi:hypothetical protein FRB90_008161 [Tulasnella sp. 427]|nr:hypothetical protein FRB90_008161 [Tulasnella sp. 427]
MARLLALLAVSVTLLTSVRACYEQCGGQGGCVCTYQTTWYSQCLPAGASSSSLATTTTSSKTTTTTSTSKTTTSTTTTTKTSTSSTASASSTPTSARYWFAFGDSYTTTGFDFTGTKPSASNVFGNPTYPGNTACGSTVTNWIDEMIVTHNESSIYAYNFAYGGATIDATLVTPYLSTVKSMTDQVNQFVTNLGSKPSYAPWTSSNAIFSFFIGINDIGNSYSQSGDRSAFSDTLLNAYFALVQKVYDVGGRKFLFINVPPVDRSPLMLAQGSTSTAVEKSVINTFNTKLAAKISTFKSANSGTTTWLYDSNAKVTQILNSPTTYGFQDATSYGTASNLAWCNNYHVSPGVHHYLALDIKSLLSGTGF